MHERGTPAGGPKSALLVELHDALAEEARRADAERAEEFKQMAQAIEQRGADLGRHLLGVITAIRDLRDDCGAVRVRGGHAPSAESVDVGVSDVVRSTFAALPFLRFPQPNRRWTAGELSRSWAGAVRGGAAKLLDPKPVQPAEPGKPAPKTAEQINPMQWPAALGKDPGEFFKNDPELKIYDDVAKTNEAHRAAMAEPASK